MGTAATYTHAFIVGFDLLYRVSITAIPIGKVSVPYFWLGAPDKINSLRIILFIFALPHIQNQMEKPRVVRKM